MSGVNRDFPTYKDNDGNFIHYTCQSINPAKLSKNGIEEIGENFGIGNGEVLKVPEKLITKKGLFARTGNEAQIVIEGLLPRL